MARRDYTYYDYQREQSNNKYDDPNYHARIGESTREVVQTMYSPDRYNACRDGGFSHNTCMVSSTVGNLTQATVEFAFKPSFPSNFAAAQQHEQEFTNGCSKYWGDQAARTALGMMDDPHKFDHCNRVYVDGNRVTMTAVTRDSTIFRDFNLGGKGPN